MLPQSKKAWQNVAVILAAIDRSLGIDLNVAISGTKRASSRKVLLLSYVGHSVVDRRRLYVVIVIESG